jgi:hypothetical protein
MRDLNYQLKELCRKNRDGSYATQAQRLALLTLMANQLHELGYRQMEAQSLKPKHVEALVKHWLGGRPRHRDDEEPHGGAPLVGREGRAAERHCPEQ